MKKLTAVFLVLCMIGGLLPIIHTTDVKAASWYFSEDFESCVDGAIPKAISVSPKGNIVETVKMDGNTSLKVEINPEIAPIDAHVNKVFSEPPKGKIIIHARIRIDNMSGSRKIIEIQDTNSKFARLLIVDGSGDLMNASEQYITDAPTLLEGKFYNIDLALDLENDSYDVYVDSKLRGSDFLMNAKLTGPLSDISHVRFQVGNVSAGCKSKFFIDDIKVYEGEKPMTEETIDSKVWNVEVGSDSELNDGMVKKMLSGTLCFYDGAKKALLDGTPVLIGDDGTGIARRRGEELLVPLRFSVEKFGGKVSYNAETQSCDITLGKSIASVTSGSASYILNDEKAAFNTPAENVDGKLLVPASFVASLSSKPMYEEKGFVLIGADSTLMNWRQNPGVMSAVSGLMAYERPRGADVISTVVERWPDNKHPRVMATAEDFERIKHEIEISDIKRAWFNSIESATKLLMEKTPIKYGTTDGIRMRDQSGQIADIVANCAFMYNITGDTTYADRAWKEIEALCSFPDWNPNHFLDIGQFMMAMGVGYDWLYNYLTPDQRTLMRESIKEKAYVELMRDYNNDPTRKRTYQWSTTPQPNNWSFVCNSGAILSALAICDEESEICGEVLSNAINNIEGAINKFAPDGAWYEGASYWTLVIETFAEMLSALDTAAGTNYGLLNAPGVAQACYFPSDVSSSYGSFNYSDAGAAVISAPELFYFAKVLGDEGLKTLRSNHMEQYGYEGTYRDMLYCDGLPAPGNVEMTLDKKFETADVASMRSSWNADEEFFASIHTGKNNAPHSHLDTGTFVIDAFGDRFAMDLGLENYNLEGGWNKYRNRAQGHNVLLVNPGMELHDQVYESYSYFSRFETNGSSAIAVTDITPAYANTLESAVRGMKMTNGKTTVVVQDEIKAKEPSTVYWHMHTEADITLSDDAREAVLDINGNKMLVKILSEGGSFTISPAQPMEGTPKVEGQNKNAGASRMAIKFENLTEATIAVAFRPMVFSERAAGAFPKVSPIDSWKLEDGEIILPHFPELDSLTINGSEVPGFAPAEKSYLYAVENASNAKCEIEAISNKGYKTNIIYPDTIPGVAYIEVDDGMFTSVYTVAINERIKSPLDAQYKEITVTKATAFSVTQEENPPKNSIDNDYSTRFSGATPNWAMYDLGYSQKVDCVAMAFYSGSTRQSEIRIEVSDDKINWTEVFSGHSSGTTDELEKFDIGGVNARYIKVHGYGCSDGAGWLSVSEFKAFEKR